MAQIYKLTSYFIQQLHLLKCDLSGSEHGVAVGGRRASLSILLTFSSQNHLLDEL